MRDGIGKRKCRPDMYRFLLGSWSRTGVSNEILMALGLLKPNDSKSLTSILTFFDGDGRAEDISDHWVT
jgi:hypothetical protein